MKILTCTETRTRLDAYLLETLSEKEQRQVAAHLASCPQCRAALEQEQARIAHLDNTVPIAPPEGMAQRAFARIVEEAAAQDAASASHRFRFLPAYSFAVLVLVCIALLPVLDAIKSIASRQLVEDNLKQLAQVYKLYASESPGEKYPPVAEYEGVWVPDLRVLWPKFINADNAHLLLEAGASSETAKSLKKALDQNSPDLEQAMRIMATGYVYHGWAFQTAEEMENIRRFIIARGNVHDDIPDGKERLYRLREGVERFMITDINNPGASAMAQSILPIMVARPQSGSTRLSRWWWRIAESLFSISPPCFVPTLYMDGHVEFIPLEDAPDNVKSMVDLLPLR